jgi:hypothetical protein
VKLTPNVRKQSVDYISTRKIQGPWAFRDFVDDLSSEAGYVELELSDEDAKSIVAEGLALRSDGAGKVEDEPEPIAEAQPAYLESPIPAAEEYDLLPFDLYDRRRQEALPIDGYKIDQWDRPHGTGGQRRKRGALTRQRFWRKTKDGKKQFFHGYRMTIRGKRKWVTDRSLSLARFNAERKRDGQDSYS